jgi:hypothetical protein
MTCDTGRYLDSSNACTLFTPCGVDEYQTTAPVQTTTNRVCAAFTTCTLGSTYEITAPVQTATNRICTSVVACNTVTEYEFVAATLLEANTCVCATGHYLVAAPPLRLRLALPALMAHTRVTLATPLVTR